MFKKNTAVTGFPFALVSATDGSATTSGTVTGYYTLDGGTQGTVAGTPAHEGNGQWSVNLLAAELNGDVVGLVFTESSSINAGFTIKTDTKIVSELNDVTTAQVNTECDTAISDASLATATNLATVDTVVDLILVDTAVIGAAGAGLTDITINAASVDAVWDELITGVSHNTANSAGKRLRQTSELGTYSGGRIYINPNGTAGTTDYENGTDANPVTTLADALTLSASLNINDFYVTRDMTMAPAADFTNQSVYGNGYTFTLGGHDYAGTHVYHASPITGTATSSGNSDHFDMLDSIIGNVTLDDAHMTRCGLTGTITLSGVGTGTPGELKMIDCFSLVPGSTTPILDFGTGSENHNVTFANYQNGIEIRNFNVTTTGGTDLLSISGTGQIVIAASCDGGSINLRGQWKITDNSGGAVTITQDDIATDVDAILVDTATTIPATITTIDTVVDGIQTDLSNGTDGLGALKALIDALNDISAANVNTEVVDALATDTYAELSAVPAANAPLSDKINWLFALARNKLTQTATTQTLRNDADGADIAASTVSDNGTTFTRGEFS